METNQHPVCTQDDLQLFANCVANFTVDEDGESQAHIDDFEGVFVTTPIEYICVSCGKQWPINEKSASSILEAWKDATGHLIKRELT